MRHKLEMRYEKKLEGGNIIRGKEIQMKQGNIR